MSFVNSEMNSLLVHGEISLAKHATTKEYVDEKVQEVDAKVLTLVSDAPQYLDTLKEISDFLGADEGDTVSTIMTRFDTVTSDIEEVKNNKLDNGVVKLPPETRFNNFKFRLGPGDTNEIYYITSSNSDPEVPNPDLSLITFGSNVPTLNVSTVLQTKFESGVTEQFEIVVLQVTYPTPVTQTQKDTVINNLHLEDGLTPTEFWQNNVLYQPSTDETFNLFASTALSGTDNTSNPIDHPRTYEEVTYNREEVRYEKLQDGGHLKIGESNAYLYIGDYWRIVANNDETERRLEIEYKEFGENGQWKLGIPFMNSSSA